MKNVNEVSIGLGKLTNSSFLAATDGKLNFVDLQYFIGSFGEAVDAVNDVNESIGELAVSTPIQVDQSVQLFSNQLTAVEENVKSDITGIYHGLLSGFRLGARLAYEKGVKDTKEGVKIASNINVSKG